MITFINGDPGDGKTALATAFGIGNMLGAEASAALNECAGIIKRPGETGFPNLKVPNDHLVYADYAIEANVNGAVLAKSKDIDGWRIGLHNPDWETVLLPPKSLVILDEVQFYYDSKRKVELPWFVKGFYQIHRHGYYDFIFISQRTNAVDKDIRALGSRFIFIVEMRNFGAAGTIWDCVEFKGTSAAELYNDSKIISASGERKLYTYIGDIFKCYDSHGRFAQHYEGRDNAVFTNVQSRNITPWDGAAIHEYNAAHNARPPDIFTKQKTKKESE
jgi:hypothetical protein